MNPDTPRPSKHPRVSVIMVKSLSATVMNQESPQKIPDKPVDEEEKKGKELDPATLSPDGALQYYAKMGDLDAMRKACEQGAKVNVPDRGPVVDPQNTEAEINHSITGDYPLHMAVGGGHVQVVKELLLLEADIESKNRIGSTSLHRAVSNEQIEIVRLLLKEGASINSTNKIGNTPLHCAAFVGSVDIAKLLIEAQATVHLTQGNLYGATPMMIAARSSGFLSKYFLSLRPSKKPNYEKKETKRSSIDEKTKQRLSITKPNSSIDTSELASPSVSEQQEQRIAAPSIVEQRTIEAPSIADSPNQINIELTSIESVSTSNESGDLGK